MSERSSKDSDGRPRIRGPEALALALILLLGAGLRAAYLVEIAETPDFEAPGRDALYHDYWARALNTGDWTPPAGKTDPEIRTTPYMRPPGYPFFLAAVYGVTGGSYLGARLAQMVFGLINAVLAFVLGRRLFGAATGLTFAALMSIYWIFIYYEGELHAPVLAVTATLALLLAAQAWADHRADDRKALSLALAGGLVLGLYAAIRPNVVLLLPVLLGWQLWVLRRRGAGGQAGRRFLAAAALTCLGVAAVVLPMTVRNQVAADDFVPLTTNAGINLYLSHHPQATGTSSLIPELQELAGLSGWTCFEYPALVRGLGRQVGRSDELQHSEASGIFTRRALEFMRENPGETLRSAGRRALLFWGPAEVSNDEVVYFDRRHSKVLNFLPGGFSAALTLALLGVAMLWRQRRQPGRSTRDPDDSIRPATIEVTVLTALFVATYFASVWPTITAARYRVPVIPCLLLFAAFGLVNWARSWRSGPRSQPTPRPALIQLAGCAVLYLLVSRPWIAYTPDESAWWFNRAAAHQRLGQLEDAAADYRRALDLGEDPDARNNLGNALVELGDSSEAIEQYQAALRHSPGHADAHRNLALALTGARRLDEAVEHFRRALEIRPDDAVAHSRLAPLLADRGHLDEALGHGHRAIELDPDNPDAHSNLGLVLAHAGRLPESIRATRAALALDPNHLQGQRNLARALAATGDREAAARHLQRAVDLEPDAASHNQLGMWLASAGDVEGALEHFTAAVELDPSAAPLANNLGNALAILGRLDEAAASFQRSVELDPGQLDARRNLVRLYGALERWGEATRAAAEAAVIADQAGASDLAQELERQAAAFRTRL